MLRCRPQLATSAVSRFGCCRVFESRAFFGIPPAAAHRLCRPLIGSSTPMTAHRGLFTKSPTLLVRGSGHASTGGQPSQQQSSVTQGWVPSTFSGGSGQTGADALTPNVRAHMMRVYNLLAMGIGSAACGSALMMLTPLGKTIPYFVPMLAGFVPLFWLMWKPPASVNARLGLFFAFTFLEGMTLAPLIKATMMKGVLGSALVLTGAVFLGFSAAALAAPRASMLALQGPLFGMLLGMVAISILNMFYPTAFAHSLVLYGGLAIFSLFVAVDTQAMIERAACGNPDHVQDAMQMFLNVVNIFVRIAQILRGE